MARSSRRANPEFDAAALRASLEAVRQTLGRYFRLTVYGGENIPAGGCMVVGCHSGVVPYDAALALVAIEQETGRLARSIGDRFWGRVRAVEQFLRRRGAIVGEREETTALLRAGNVVLVMPGGAADMTRPYWRDPYRVLPHKGWAPGRGGFVKVALAAGIPIVPVAIVGTEETHVMLWNAEWLAGLLGAPFFPILAFPFPLPAKIYVRFGRPIRFPRGPHAASQAVVDRMTERVRRNLQALIDETRRHRRGIVWSRFAGNSPVRVRPRPRGRQSGARVGVDAGQHLQGAPEEPGHNGSPFLHDRRSRSARGNS
jgi:1-acyl-sn-glycerol-3-phosphate acyltransferase